MYTNCCAPVRPIADDRFPLVLVALRIVTYAAWFVRSTNVTLTAEEIDAIAFCIRVRFALVTAASKL